MKPPRLSDADRESLQDGYSVMPAAVSTVEHATLPAPYVWDFVCQAELCAEKGRYIDAANQMSAALRAFDLRTKAGPPHTYEEQKAPLSRYMLAMGVAKYRMLAKAALIDRVAKRLESGEIHLIETARAIQKWDEE